MVDRRHREQHQRRARRRSPTPTRVRGGRGERDQHDAGGQRERGVDEVQPAPQPRLDCSAERRRRRGRGGPAPGARRRSCSRGYGTCGRERTRSDEDQADHGVYHREPWPPATREGRAYRRASVPGLRGRMVRALPTDQIPKHVGVMLDGNRRWAQGRRRRHRPTATAPAPTRSAELLDWCEEVGVEVVTLWLLSTDNLNRRADELEPLLDDHRGRRRRRSPRSGAGGSTRVGALDLLPGRTTARAQGGGRRRPRDVDGLLVNVAVGYGGRREIADAVRSLLARARRARAPRIEELAAGPRRRAHRRAPLHQGPARPRPGDPHLGRAAAGRVPAVAERALGVLLLRGASGPTSGGSTSCARSARTPQRERRFGVLSRRRRSGRRSPAPHPAFGRVARVGGPRRSFRGTASGEARRAGRTSS